MVRLIIVKLIKCSFIMFNLLFIISISSLKKGCLYKLHLQFPLLERLRGISPSRPSSPAPSGPPSPSLKYRFSPLLLGLPGELLLEVLEPRPQPNSFHHGPLPQSPMDPMDPGPIIQLWGTPFRPAYFPSALWPTDHRAPVPLHWFHLGQ